MTCFPEASGLLRDHHWESNPPPTMIDAQTSPGASPALDPATPAPATPAQQAAPTEPPPKSSFRSFFQNLVKTGATKKFSATIAEEMPSQAAAKPSLRSKLFGRRERSKGLTRGHTIQEESPSKRMDAADFVPLDYQPKLGQGAPDGGKPSTEEVKTHSVVSEEGDTVPQIVVTPPPRKRSLKSRKTDDPVPMPRGRKRRSRGDAGKKWHSLDTRIAPRTTATPCPPPTHC